MEGYFLAEILEAIKLNVDESGAKVENEGIMIALRCAMIPNHEEPKRIILDRDFWLVMK